MNYNCLSYPNNRIIHRLYLAHIASEKGKACFGEVLTVSEFQRLLALILCKCRYSVQDIDIVQDGVKFSSSDQSILFFQTQRHGMRFYHKDTKGYKNYDQIKFARRRDNKNYQYF